MFYFRYFCLKALVTKNKKNVIPIKEYGITMGSHLASINLLYYIHEIYIIAKTNTLFY